MSETTAECYVCGGRHEVVMWSGIRLLGCPSVPEGYFIPGPEAWQAVMGKGSKLPARSPEASGTPEDKP